MKSNWLLSLFSLMFVGIFLHVNDLVAKKKKNPFKASNRAFEKAFDKKNYKQDKRIEDAKHSAQEALRLLQEHTYKKDNSGRFVVDVSGNKIIEQQAVLSSVDDLVERFATYQTQADFVTKTVVWQTLKTQSQAIAGFDKKLSDLQESGVIISEVDVDAKVAAWEKEVVNPEIVALNDKLAALKALIYKK